jgi:putative mRNA 3-end processing factor
MPLLKFAPKGIYCQQGDFYIDPWFPVEKAIITHAHSDHARSGMGHYLCQHLSKEVLKLRLGQKVNVQSIAYNEPVFINGVQVSLHPSGHLPGSAQVRVEYKGEVWVASGDYKIENDGLADPFEPVRCQTFITECTFGLPIFDWAPQVEVFSEINNWWLQNQRQNRTSVLFAYSLGKAQRLLAGLNPEFGQVYVHDSIFKTNEALVFSGLKLPAYNKISGNINKKDFGKAIVITPGSSAITALLQGFGDYKAANCSGWMAVRKLRNRSNDVGFVLSDHADWKGLIEAVKSTGATHVITTHGYTRVFAKYLNEIGIEASTVSTGFSGNGGEEIQKTNSTEA